MTAQSSLLPELSPERATFLDHVRTACATGRPMAVGKLGFSEQMWAGLHAALSERTGARQRRAILLTTAFHACRQSGVFPRTLDFVQEFSRWYADSVAQVDAAGVNQGSVSAAALTRLDPSALVLPADGIEPDRSSPFEAGNDYLDSMRGKRILIVSSAARILADRATPEVFESVWQKVQRPWFLPGSVESLEFPYIYSSRTEAQYTDIRSLHESIVREMSQREFDIALIGAAALGVPLAAAAKRMGKVGISLGGHLQALFGAGGRRWMNDPYWQSTHMNRAWITLPAPDGIPQEFGEGPDDGAYWM